MGEYLDLIEFIEFDKAYVVFMYLIKNVIKHIK